jgi:hypothetical protein
MIQEFTEKILKNSPGITITEEELVKFLLTQQAEGKNFPKRRSKIHKEFTNTLQE